jgi:hypothetical protein
MAGATEDHNLISLNLVFAPRTHLRGRRWKIYVADH